MENIEEKYNICTNCEFSITIEELKRTGNFHTYQTERFNNISSIEIQCIFVLYNHFIKIIIMKPVTWHQKGEILQVYTKVHW